MNHKMRLWLGAIATILTVGIPSCIDTPVSANDVHHPDCVGLVKDQPPFVGLEVTVPPGYSLVTMWLKIGDDHVPVPAVSSGEVYTPADLSGWPLNQNGKPKEISHVDYCVPPTPTTTTIPRTTTTTTTTVPVTTTTLPKIVVTPTFSYIPPTCTTEGTWTLDKGAGWTWFGYPDTAWTAFARPGYVLSAPVMTPPLIKAKLTGAQCAVTTTTVLDNTTTTSTTVQQPTTTTTVKATQQPTTTPAPVLEDGAVRTLAHTGSQLPWYFKLLIAAGVITLGILIVRAVKRPDDI